MNRRAPTTSPASLVEKYPGPAVLTDAAAGIVTLSAAGADLAATIESGDAEQLVIDIFAVSGDHMPRLANVSIGRGAGLRHLELTMFSLIEDDAIYVAVLGKDVTNQRTLTENLIESRKLLKDIEAVSSDFGWETDSDGRFAYVSSRGALGYHAHELQQSSARLLAPDPDAIVSPWPFESDDIIDSLEIWLRTKDGSLACCEVSSRPVYTAEGKLKAVRGAAKDVTERKNSQIALDNAYRRIRADLRAAAESLIQQLPQPAETGSIRFDWIFEPSSDIGGDIFDVVSNGRSKFTVFYLIDVAGHGVPAALSSVTLQALVTGASRSLLDLGGDAIALWEDRLAEMFKSLNDRFLERIEDDRYFTMVYAVLDTESGEGLMIQAGHPSPLLLKPGSDAVEAIGSGGFPLGILPDAGFDALPFRLDHGDRLVVYSDGFTDCVDSQGREFGEAGLRQWLAECRAMAPGPAMAELRSRITEWNAEPQFPDDVSLLVIERTKS